MSNERNYHLEKIFLLEILQRINFSSATFGEEEVLIRRELSRVFSERIFRDTQLNGNLMFKTL